MIKKNIVHIEISESLVPRRRKLHSVAEGSLVRVADTTTIGEGK